MNRRKSVVGIVAAVIVGSVSCVKHHANQQAFANMLPEQLVWTGAIRAVEHRSGMVEPSKRAVMNGSVRMVQDPANRSHSRIDITLSSPRGDNFLSWALSTSRCGSSGVPVLPINNFQPLEVGSSGRADASVSVPFAFPTQGEYHVDVFIGNQAVLNDVIACANLSLDQKQD
jgi:hypothetical protein